MVTKKKIAEYLGISRTAVSLVLNNTHSSTISSETRSRILQAAKELGYREVEGSPKLCYILYDRNADDPRYMIDLQLIEQTASQSGYGLIFMNVTKAPESINKLKKALASKEIDGCIVSGDVDEYLNCVLRSYETPYVLFGLPLTENLEDLSYGMFDDKKLTYDATRYLISLGHTRIALFMGSLEYKIHQLALEGFLEAHESSGIPFDRSLIQISDDENGYELCRRAEMLKLDYTAAFCTNTVIQFGVLQRLQSTGVSVPQKVSLIGSGLTELVKVSVPQLTTYYVEDSEKTRIVTMLIDLINHHGSGKRTYSFTEFSRYEGGTASARKS